MSWLLEGARLQRLAQSWLQCSEAPPYKAFYTRQVRCRTRMWPPPSLPFATHFWPGSSCRRSCLVPRCQDFPVPAGKARGQCRLKVASSQPLPSRWGSGCCFAGCGGESRAGSRLPSRTTLQPRASTQGCFGNSVPGKLRVSIQTHACPRADSYVRVRQQCTRCAQE